MTKKNQSTMSKRRHEARRAGLKILYQWQLNESMSRNMFTDFIAENSMEEVDVDYLQLLFLGVTERLSEIDALLTPVVDRKLLTLNPVELAALRLAAFEFMHCIEIPYKIIINESIELVKEFGAEGGYKYINGVLDKLATSLRKVEVASASEK